jgi:ribosomal protein L24p/L26e, archaeal
MMSEQVKKTFHIYAVRTTVGQEKNVARMISNRVDEASGEISSIFILPSLRGYVFVEASDRDKIAMIVQGLPHVKSRPLTEVSLDELKSHLVTRPAIETLKEGELVEVISGPLRGVTGRVLRIDKQKDSVTIELLESTYPLPISVPARHLRPVTPSSSG